MRENVRKSPEKDELDKVTSTRNFFTQFNKTDLI